MLSFVFNKHIYPSNDVTNCAESAIYIFNIFVNNLATKRDSVLLQTANPRTFHALSNRTIKIFVS